MSEDRTTEVAAGSTASYSLTRFEEILAKIPPERRAAIEVESARLIAEEYARCELRAARERAREALAAKTPDGDPDAFARLERRADRYLKALRRQVEAMGGELEVVARLPDHPPVRIDEFRDLGG